MINTTKIAINNLKQNKSKSLLIAITIVLTTTLLASVGMTCIDWNYANQLRVRQYFGTQHVVYGGVDDKTHEIISNHVDVDRVGLVNGIGSINYEDETKIGLSYVNDNSLEFSNIELLEGEYPTKGNEIAIDDLALEKLGYEQKINQKIKISYEDTEKEGMTENEFIVTGITKASSNAKARKQYSVVVTEEYMRNTRDMSKENFNAFVTLKGEENLTGEELKIKAEEVGYKLGLRKSQIIVNEDYINTLKPDMDVVLGGVVVSLIVILSGILVIYNIFYLSIVTKVQEFGKLRAIGATKKQVKSIVLKEGMILSMIAIPIGMIIGYLINELILYKVFSVGFEGYESKSKVAISTVVVVISFITVLISLLKPMKIAAKVSIVDAIRYNGEQNVKQKTRKGYEFINIKRLTHANLNVNKKRTYVTLLSLTLSGIIYIVISSLMMSMDAEVMARNHHSYDFSISLDNYTFGDEQSPNTELNMLQTKNPLSKEFISEIENLDGVEKVEVSNMLKVNIEEYDKEYKYDSIYGVTVEDLEDLEYYLIDGKIDLEKLKSGDEIIISYPEIAEANDIKVGDSIKLPIYDGDKVVNKIFKVQAITDYSGMFLIHEEAFKKIATTNTTNKIGIYTEKGKYDSIKPYIENEINSNEYFSASYIEKEIEAYELSIAFTKGIAYSLVLIIGVIGFINLINSMITSTITRKKELGMLQAIGLTDKQLVKMLNIEAMFYTSIMCIGSLTIGTGVGYLAVWAFRKTGASYAQYALPLPQMITMVVLSVGAQLLLTYLISKNFNKESLIDRVRYSE